MQQKKIYLSIILGILFITIIIFLKDNTSIYTYINNTNTFLEDSSYLSISNSINNNEEEYNLILEIPSIDLYKGAYNINSSYNNVSYGLEVLSDSTYPNTDNSVTIIASHSGLSIVSYFKNLKYLEYNSIANIYYDNILYTYTLEQTLLVDKTGTIDLYIDTNTKSLVLITCKENTNQQYVFIFYIKKETTY